MYKFVCSTCGNTFESFNKQSKFCGRNCYYISIKGRVKSEDEREKLRVANTGRDNKYRGKAISLSKSQRDFSEEELNSFIQAIKVYDWVTNLSILIEKSGIEKTYGVVKKSKKKYLLNIIHEYKVKEFRVHPTMFPIPVQKWSLEKMLKFKEDAKTIYFRDCMKNYNIGEKTFMNICSYYNIKYSIQKYHSFRFTKPEKIVDSILKELNVAYIRERYVSKCRWRIDFMIDETFAIEVQGDYWHGNPNIYTKYDLNDMQIRNMQNDIKKKSWLIDNNYKYLALWECDIYNNLEDTKNKIINFLGDIYDNKCK